MAPKFVISSLTLVAVFLVLAEPAKGLKCNVCFDFAFSSFVPVGAPCEVMPCDSFDDVKNAMRLGYKQQAGKQSQDLSETSNFGEDNGKYVCIRNVIKDIEDKDAYIWSTCQTEDERFPPSDSPYPVKDVLQGPTFETEAAESDVVSKLKEKADRLRGNSYVCNEETGAGPNCGENAEVKVVNEDAEGAGVEVEGGSHSGRSAVSAVVGDEAADAGAGEAPATADKGSSA